MMVLEFHKVLYKCFYAFLRIIFYMPFDSCMYILKYDQIEKIQMLSNNKMSFLSVPPLLFFSAYTVNKFPFLILACSQMRS